MRRTRDWLKSGSSAPFAVQSTQLGTGVISSAGMFAAGVVDAAAIGADQVGVSEIATGILPWTSGRFALTNPAAVEEIGSVAISNNVTLAAARLRIGTLPTNLGDSFSFNVRIDGVGNIFASDQVVTRNPNVMSFRVTTDNGVTYTNRTTEVTDGGAGVAPLASLDTLANGDWIVVGSSQPFAAINIDMAAAVNGSAAALTAQYWNGAWTALNNVVDGTAAAGATFGQDGVITFDTPSDWVQNAVDGVTAYHVRLSVSAALDASVDVTEVDVVRDTGWAYLFTPDQNLTVPAGALAVVHCTEADANAANLELELVGTVTT